MTDRIQSFDVSTGRLDPAEAEVCISVRPERLFSITQARGRFVGPRCPYATTVEVAYPLREHSRDYESIGFSGSPHLYLRAIIPEPSLWDPESPFLYEGVLELWQGGQRCNQVRFTHGLHTLALGPRSLRCNGRPLSLRGVALGSCSEVEARSLHQAGYNTLLASIGTDAAVWDLADRFGFLVLARIRDRAELKAETQRAQAFRKHPCCLGWVVTPEAVEEELARMVAQNLPDAYRGQFLGMELKQPPAGPLPDHVSFLVAEENVLPQLAEIALPKIVLRRAGAGGATERSTADSGGNVLGWIDLP
jgi:hypothetical protein